MSKPVDPKNPAAKHTVRSEEWKPLLENVVNRIQDLNIKTERDFLLIGANLQDFATRAGEISKIAISASSIMSGDEIRGAVGGLKGMIDQLEELFHEADNATSVNLEGLRAVGRTLREVFEELQELKGSSRDLKMLALSTKIQSTRTGKGLAAFMQLGNDIAGMSEVIHSKSADLSDETARLAGFVGDVTGNLRGLKSRQQYQTTEVMRGTRSIVESLGAISTRSEQEVERIKGSSDQINSSIQELVTAIQYQDISRQAMDKIRIDLRKILHETVQSNSSTQQGMPAPEIAACSESLRQASAIRETGDQIKGAIKEMVSGLRLIAENIADMGNVTSAASKDTARFLHQLEQGMASVTSFLSDVVESSREMSDALSSLAESVEGMSSYSEEIEVISSDVELISLNARIMAAQTGLGGAGMGVIAGAVHTTASESEQRRKSLSERFENITLASMELKTAIEDTVKGKERELDQVVRELGVFLDALRIMQQRIVSMLNEIDNLSSGLYESIKKSLGQITIQDTVDPESRGVAERLEDLASRLADELNPQALVDLDPTSISLPAAVSMSLDEKLAKIQTTLSIDEPEASSTDKDATHLSDGDIILF
jgi:methyl-accepting chemotaxis protein